MGPSTFIDGGGDRGKGGKMDRVSFKQESVFRRTKKERVLGRMALSKIALVSGAYEAAADEVFRDYPRH